jgi:hypothetical protein
MLATPESILLISFSMTQHLDDKLTFMIEMIAGMAEQRK